MGLLEKASRYSDSSLASPAAEEFVGGIAGAVHGLRARADLIRQRTTQSEPEPVTTPASAAPQTERVAPVAGLAATSSKPAADSGIRIHGLRQRAEALRSATRNEIPPLPAGAGRGLLARARSYRQEQPSDAPPPRTTAGAVARAPEIPPRSHTHQAEPSPSGDFTDTPEIARDLTTPSSDATRRPTSVPEPAREVPAAQPIDPYVVEELEHAPVDFDEDFESAKPAARGSAALFEEDEDLILSAPEPAVESSVSEPTRDEASDAGSTHGGLLERARQLREEPEPAAPIVDSDSEQTTSAQIDEPSAHEDFAADRAGAEFEDPLFDDLIPESYEGVRPPEPAAESDSAQPVAPFVDDEPSNYAEEFRDFDDFLEREILPEDLPDAPPVRDRSGLDAPDAATDSEQSPAPDGLFADEAYDQDYDLGADPDGLPRWPYEPPGKDADPARDGEGGERLLSEDEDPFGLWEQDAEQEAEEQARQLELRGDSGKRQDNDENNLLFEVDEGFTTTPVEAHIASQKKIDHYLSLFDITKEISNISEFDELWENILYAIMGQVGAETICILSSTQRVSSGAIFYPVIHSGFELPEGWALKRGDEIYDQMAASTGVRYAEEFLNSLQNPISPMERRILESTRAKIIVPLKNMNQMFGIVILGGQVSGDDYTVDDLEFLTLLGEISAVGVDRVLSRIEFERDTEELRRRNMVHGSMFSLARRASGVKSLDDIYDILTRHLREDFYAESFSVVLLSPRERRYRIFAGNEISPESIEKFSLDVNSELIATISNLVRVYDLKDFRENREITSCYTNDDLGLMQHYWIVPLINMNWLVGFITIHRTRVPWTEFHRELMVTAAEIVSSVFANCIIMGERESLFRDPFSPLEERLKQELEKSAQFKSPVSLVDIRVKTIRRILEINPGDEVSAFLMTLNRSIASALFETDFMARVGQGRFALILPGRGRVEAEIFVKKLKAEFKRMRLLPGSPIDVQYTHQIISAPEDAAEPGKMLSIFE